MQTTWPGNWSTFWNFSVSMLEERRRIIQTPPQAEELLLDIIMGVEPTTSLNFFIRL